ncbi:hypothetical protein BC828DRAFT_349280 [Blastocladiella britannica]|nr:hypothetical protein BC828DRAFT_349280 [Blastocladiella britannica]
MFFDSSLEWNWQIFDFETATFGAPLLVFSSAIFWREKLFESMHIPIDKFLRCMHRIETGYRATISYHNSTHATDVLHGAYVFSHCEILQNNLSDLERVALYFAASIHDHQHPGVSNVFLIAKQDPLAVLYSDRSVLEQHHLASAFAVLNSPECNFTADWDPATRKSFRDLVIELVLATDLKLQAELMTVWKTRVECFDVRLSTDRTMMLKLIMKASDVANPSKELPIYREWIERIMQEFFEQGDEERRLGLPISPYCDSAQPNLPGSQVGFMTWIVLPLYEAIHQVMPLPVQIGQLRSSFEYWKATQAAAQATAAAAAAVVSPSQIPEEGKQPKEKPNKFDEPLSPVIVRSNKNYSSDSNDSEDDAAVQSSSTTGVTQALLPDRIPSLTQGPGR